MNERREKLWAECVQQAKSLVKKYEDVKMDIAELAMKACSDAEVKGHKLKYTVSRFANETGLNPATLQTWVEARRVIIRLPVDKRGYSISHYREVAKQIPDDASDAQIERQLNRVVRKHQDRNYKFVMYTAKLKSLLKNARDEESVKQCDDDVIEEILHLCSEVAHYIDLYKNNRRKKSA